MPLASRASAHSRPAGRRDARAAPAGLEGGGPGRGRGHRGHRPWAVGPRRVGRLDDADTAHALARRICELRIFEDDEGRTNRSLLDVEGETLVVSQFTLYADTSRGRRPGFVDAALPDHANRLYRLFCSIVEGAGIRVATGRFAAKMAVELINDGPFTIWLDTDER